MSINPELQAKIDALEDEALKAEIIDILALPPEGRASDEVIFETVVAGRKAANEQRARRRRWHGDEVEAFAQYFKEESPEDYVEFLRQEMEFNEISSWSAWRAMRMISRWMPGVNSIDSLGMFNLFRAHVRSRSD